MSMNGMSAFLVYGTVAAIYLISCNLEFTPEYREEFVKHKVFLFTSFGGKAKFLTILDLYAQTIYFILCTLSVFYQLVSGKPHQQTYLGKVCNFLYTTLIFPVGACVTALFWGIYLINRDLIFPKILDQIIPPWHNHVMHTLPLVGALIDNLITKHSYPKSIIKGLIPTIVYSVGYLIWILIVYIYGNFWVYPILNVLGPFYRVVFFAFSILLLAGFYVLGKVINSIIWGQTQNQEQKKN